MKTATRFPACIHDDLDLLQLELEIARRADQLRRFFPETQTPDDRECWLRAEAEVLDARGAELMAISA